jgi:hypothetical protein
MLAGVLGACNRIVARFFQRRRRPRDSEKELTAGRERDASRVSYAANQGRACEMPGWKFFRKSPFSFVVLMDDVWLFMYGR